MVDVLVIPSDMKRYLSMLEQFGQLTNEDISEVLIDQGPLDMANARRDAAIRIFDRQGSMPIEDWSVMFS